MIASARRPSENKKPRVIASNWSSLLALDSVGVLPAVRRLITLMQSRVAPSSSGGRHSIEAPDLSRLERASSRLLRDLSQDRCLARLGPGARRDAHISRLPTGVLVWLSHGLRSRRAPCGERLERGLSALEVAVPSSLHITVERRGKGDGRDHRDGPA